MKSISGSCLCKLIKFTIHNECRKVVLCHCTMCQKSNAEFSAYTKVKMNNFSLDQKKTLKWFKSSNLSLTELNRRLYKECANEASNSFIVPAFNSRALRKD